MSGWSEPLVTSHSNSSPTAEHGDRLGCPSRGLGRFDPGSLLPQLERGRQG